jgi:polyhydroxyalkanoate synthesis regulator phasin
MAGCLGLALCAVVSFAQAQEAPTDAQSLMELRNTVVNLLEGLVQRGVITRQDAQAMVADAQRRAETETATARAQQDAEKDAVRVTYVPEVVKDEIVAAVREDVQGVVVEDVVARAKAEGWGVPGALPEWVRNVDVSGALRVRGEGDYFDELNAVNTYLNFNAINDSGGIGLAGPAAFMNTTEDRARLRARLRLDLTAHVAEHITARLAFTTGNIDDPISMNATLANYGRRLTFAVQDASIEWSTGNRNATREFDFLAGRFANPFLSTSALWDVDLSFEGLAGRVAFDVFRRRTEGFEPGVFLTLGAFPLEEVQLADDDKWLYAGQVGIQVPIAERSYFRLASGYYQFRNIVGLRNAPDSRLTDYTAPALLGRGNTLFDIRNDLDPATELFALASDYEIADVVAQLDFGAFGRNRLLVTAEYLENRGYDPMEIAARLGRAAPEARVKGRQVEISIGREVRQAADWRVFAAYRYLERDAVLDAFTDSDFALGGTDTEGFYVGFDLGLTRNTWFTTKWLSSNEIDGPPLSIDVLQLDFNTRF